MLNDDKIIDRLFKEYSGSVFNYSLSLLKNYDDADDAVQDIFVRLIKSKESFKGNCSYKTWIMIITRNYCLTKLNGKANAPQRIDEKFIKAYNPSIETSMAIDEALGRLSREDFELIYLREYEKHSYREIAEILGITVDNLKVKLFRVRKQLKEYLK